MNWGFASSPEPRRWLIVTALLFLATLLRVSVIFYQDISGDDATVALAAKNILRGQDFPAFFYHQAYHGSLNGFHLVPALLLFGPSALVVRLNAVVYSLLFPLGLYLLGRRVFDETTGRVALLLAAIPPFLLSYWSTVAEPHFETNIFGVLLLLLALAMAQAKNERRYVRGALCLGLTAGLAWWTSPKVIEVLIPAILVAWVRNPRLPLCRAGRALLGSFLLGSLPAWLFAISRRGLGDLNQLFDAGLNLPGERLSALVTTVVPTLLGTYYWPADTSARQVALLANIAVYLIASAVGLYSAIRLRRAPDAPTTRESGIWMLLLTLVVPFGLLCASAFVPDFHRDTTRYVLPVYIPLLLFVAALVTRLRRWSRLAAAALLVLLLTFNVWTNLQFMWPLHPDERARRNAHIGRRQAMIQFLDAHPLDALYVDDPHASLRWAFYLDRVAVSNLSNEIYPPHAVEADAARRVGILIQRHVESFQETLAAAGIRSTHSYTPQGWLYTDFALESQAYRELSAVGWRALAFPHPESAHHAVDRDAGTRWESQAERRTGMWFQIDLGQVRRIGMVTWLPGGVDDLPVGFRLEASRDGREWVGVREVPAYYGYLYWSGDHLIGRARWGRVEVRFRPRAARYLRITHLGEDPDFWWTIRELFVYEAVNSPAGNPADSAALVERLLQSGIQRVYADHGIGARLFQLSRGKLIVLPSNLLVDAHGRAPHPNLLPRLRIHPGTAIVYPVALPSADSIEQALRAGGVDFTREEIGSDRVLSRFARPEPPGTPLSRSGWSVSGSLTGPNPHILFDGQLHTRWTTPGPQTPGAWLRVDLRESTVLSGLALDLGPFRSDYPRGLALEISHDGLHWEVVETTPLFLGPLRWAGTHLLRDGVDRVLLRFGPVRVRSLRLIQTGRDPISPWSIAELYLFTP